MTRKTPIVLETLSNFWCEAAVLVAVFGLLDEVMKHERLTLAWTITSVSCERFPVSRNDVEDLDSIMTPFASSTLDALMVLAALSFVGGWLLKRAESRRQRSGQVDSKSRA